jgi:hypothetical protein
MSAFEADRFNRSRTSPEKQLSVEAALPSGAEALVFCAFERHGGSRVLPKT